MVFTGTWALWGVQEDEKRHVIVRRFVESKGGIILDQDNISGAFKPIGDSLKKCRILKDDTQAHVSFEIFQDVVGKGFGRVEFEVVTVGASQ